MPTMEGTRATFGRLGTKEIFVATMLGLGIAILSYIDVSVPRGMLGVVGYPAVVALSMRFGRRALFACAVLISVLIAAAGFVAAYRGFVSEGEIADRVVALMSVWIVAALLASRLRVEQKLRDRYSIAGSRRGAHLDLMREVLLSSQSFEEKVRRIAEISGVAMQVEYVGIYRNLEGRPIIRCLDIWQQSTRTHRRQPDFPENPNPELARILTDQFIIATDDVAQEPLLEGRRKVFADLGVHATLAAGIFVDGRLAGQITFGNVGGARQWTSEDKISARALAVLLALLYSNFRHERALAAFDLMSEGVIVEDESGYPVYANEAARLLAGVPDEANESAGPETVRFARPPAMMSADNDRHAIPFGARDLEIQRARLPDGGVISRINDVTARNTARRERSDLQDRLQQAAKMEAIGQLAGGVAHDFNNILGSIMGFATFLVQDLAPNSPQRGFAQKILSASHRGKELVDQILAFARARVVERAAVPLQTVVAQSAELVASVMPVSVALEIETNAGNLAVFGSAVQLCRMIVNLCINARDAVSETGRVVLSIGRASPEDVAIAARTTAPNETAIGEFDPARDYALVRISDNGKGIPEDVLPHIFEPFFTTKGRMRGSGLGLAVVLGVVQSHEGYCRVTTRPGAGTTVSIFLPLMPDASIDASMASSGSTTSALGGRERVLVVDDESDLVDMLSIGLARLGYESVGVTDPGEALAAFEEDPEAWDIVVTDQIMPDMRGMDLVRRLKSIRPDIRTILCSGYSDGVEEATGKDIDIYIRKPVDTLEIARRIRALVDSGG